MRINVYGQDVTLESSGDLSTKQYLFVVPSAPVAGGQQARVSVANANRMIGILQNKPNAAGLGAVVRVDGRSKLVVDGTTPIAVGDPLKANSSGQGIKAAADKDHVGAIAMEASTALGDVIDALICNYDLAV